MTILVLVVHGAYGRDYDSWEACKADWEDGKDFKILGGPYCSVRDLDRMKKDGVVGLFFMTGHAVSLGHIWLSKPPINGMDVAV